MEGVLGSSPSGRTLANFLIVPYVGLMKTYYYIFIAIIAVVGLFLLIPKTEQASKKGPKTMTTDPTTFEKISSKKAVIKTEKGDIAIELFADDAPKTVTNFATLAKNGYFNDLTFHRVEPGFVIQGGDPNGNGTGGTSVYGETFEDELNPETASFRAGYKQGVVAMANRGPNTNSSQFFIMLEDNETLPKNYTIFGKVTSGMEVVKKIAVGDIIASVVIE